MVNRSHIIRHQILSAVFPSLFLPLSCFPPFCNFGCASTAFALIFRFWLSTKCDCNQIESIKFCYVFFLPFFGLCACVFDCLLLSVIYLSNRARTHTSRGIINFENKCFVYYYVVFICFSVVFCSFRPTKVYWLERYFLYIYACTFCCTKVRFCSLYFSSGHLVYILYCCYYFIA